MDGFELTEKLKANEKTKNIKVVLITQYANSEGEARAKKLGVDYLQKQKYTQLSQSIEPFLTLDSKLKQPEEQEKLV